MRTGKNDPYLPKSCKYYCCAGQSVETALMEKQSTAHRRDQVSTTAAQIAHRHIDGHQFKDYGKPLEFNLKPMMANLVKHTVLPAALMRVENENMMKVPSKSQRSEILKFKEALYNIDVGCGNFRELLPTCDQSIEGQLRFVESVARALGDDWLNDNRNFVDITIAMGRLQSFVRALVVSHSATIADKQVGSALIAVPDGEAHRFAQCLLEEIFRARGWTTILHVAESSQSIQKAIAAHPVDMICLSWVTTALEPEMHKLITDLHEIPVEDRPGVIAGGSASVAGGKWLVRLGVDHISDNAYGAIAAAEALLKNRTAMSARKNTIHTASRKTKSNELS